MIYWQFPIVDQHEENKIHTHQSIRESAILDRLRKGPEFKDRLDSIEAAIERENLKGIKELITPTSERNLYPLVIGEHGTGKTSLIMRAVEDLKEPKGVIYVDIPGKTSEPVDLSQLLQEALDWKADLVIDSDKCNQDYFLQVSINKS